MLSFKNDLEIYKYFAHKLIKFGQMFHTNYVLKKRADDTYRFSVKSDGSAEATREVTEYIPCILASRTLQLKETNNSLYNR